MKSVYLDYNATTPVAKEVTEAIVSALTDAWGNPSSPYEIGVKARAVCENARRQIGLMINASASTIVFTSGGTESNNLIIHSAVQFRGNTLKQLLNISDAQKACKPHIITTNIEHDSIIKPLEHLYKQGVIQLTVLPVSKLTGCIVVNDIIAEIREETCLVTVMMANNETGFIQPIGEIGAKIAALNQVRKVPVLFHTDAAQAIGKIAVSVDDLKVHFLTIVGHKFYGPRIGAVYVKDSKGRVPFLSPCLFGGGQEKGLRPGTENTAMISGLGKAAELVIEHTVEYQQHMLCMRDYLEMKLKTAFGSSIKFNNVRPDVPRLPNTISIAFCFDDVSGSKIFSLCPEIFASTGAACHGISLPSAVLMNSGVSKYLAERTLRLSVGRETSKSDVDFAVERLQYAFSELCVSK